MPTESPNMPTESPKDRGRSTENFGQGQSGYTGGRVEGDPSLRSQTRNERAAGSDDERDERAAGSDDERNERAAGTDDQHPLQGTDDRFEGAGGLPWVPEERAPDDEQKGP